MIEMARARTGEASRIQLSPAATKRFTDRLARMRGAVMKMGQLMSMDGTDVFTPEAAEIMATLRDRSEPMPMSQLTVKARVGVGQGLEQAVQTLRVQPMAAASIGQVHRAETRDGRRLALKVQFPGCARASTATSTTWASCRATWAWCRRVGPQPMLDEARRQLHQEADYEAEAASWRLSGIDRR
jgi:aarF domain-containing kinase